jgi:hypothetical protein
MTDCKYKGLCKNLLYYVDGDGLDRNFMDQWNFNINFSQNFGPCSSGGHYCQLYNGHEATSKLTKIPNVHITLMAGVLKEKLAGKSIQSRKF